MTEDYNFFLCVVRFALGTEAVDLSKIDANRWKTIYTLCREQSITGLVFNAISKVSKDGIHIPQTVLFDWLALSKQIELQNQLLNKRVKETFDIFSEACFRGCLLKGQGNALMYPSPYIRTSGDIDIWIDGKRKDIKDYVMSRYPDSKDGYVHIEAPIFKDVDVEVHYIPSLTVGLRFQKRFDLYTELNREVLFTHEIELPDGIGKVCTPSFEFNVVYQLMHMKKHFFTSGVGLRHVIDYFYLLKNKPNSYNQDNINGMLRKLGLMKFTKAIMWVLCQVLGLPDEYLITTQDSKRGKLLLYEIMRGGNLGKKDSRYYKKLWQKSESLALYVRNLHMFWLYPEEVLTVPIDGIVRRYLLKW